MPRGRKVGQYTLLTEAEYRLLVEARRNGHSWRQLPGVLGRPGLSSENVRKSFTARRKREMADADANP